MYELGVWNPAQVASVDGAELLRGDGHDAKLRLTTNAGAMGEDARRQVTLHFTGGPRPKKQS